MKKIIYMALFTLALSACKDPYNTTISEFKKSKIGQSLFDCGGVRSTYEYKIFTPSSDDRKTVASKNISVLEVVAKKEFNNGSLGVARFQYDVNSEIYKFEPRFIEVSGIENLPPYVQYDKYCKPNKEY